MAWSILASPLPGWSGLGRWFRLPAVKTTPSASASSHWRTLASCRLFSMSLVTAILLMEAWAASSGAVFLHRHMWLNTQPIHIRCLYIVMLCLMPKIVVVSCTLLVGGYYYCIRRVGEYYYLLVMQGLLKDLIDGCHLSFLRWSKGLVSTKAVAFLRWPQLYPSCLSLGSIEPLV